MLLNCDMGEHTDSHIDALLMPYIDQASIACGGHAGDAASMLRTLELAKAHNVTVGAHPSYNDREGFGRRSSLCSTADIGHLVTQQTNALARQAATLGLQVRYVKPHGALYNDMMAKNDVRAAVMTAVAAHPLSLSLMLQATAQHAKHQREAQALGLPLWFEAFSDRCYDDSGLLRPRGLDRAVLHRDEMLAQVKQLCESGAVTSFGCLRLPLTADTLCIHGDNPVAVDAISAIKAALR